MGEKTKKPKLVILDLDNVVINVSTPYRDAIKKTAEFFLGRMLDHNDLHDVMHNGGNHYERSDALIGKFGGSFRMDAIKKKFQEYYVGRNFNGYILDEQLMMDEKFLKKLKKYKLGLVSHRCARDAEFSLRRLKIHNYFKAIDGIEQLEGERHPNECLSGIVKKLKGKKNETVYVGCAPHCLKASQETNIPFIGIVPPNTEKAAFKEHMETAGASLILDNVKDLAKIL